jgi:hypothetical protein
VPVGAARRSRSAGKHIYIPHFTLAPADAAAPAQKSFAPDMRMLRLHDVAAFEALKENAFGIREFAAAGAEMLGECVERAARCVLVRSGAGWCGAVLTCGRRGTRCRPADGPRACAGWV